MDQTAMMWNFEEALSESADSLGTSSAGSEVDPIATLLVSMGKDAASGLSLGSTAAGGGRSMVSGSFGLAPTPPPSNNGLNSRETTGVLSDWTQLMTGAEIAKAVSVETMIKCLMCRKNYNDPRVLACFHSFCKPCLEKQIDNNERIICSQCLGETQISPSLGIDGLLSDYGLRNAVKKFIVTSDEKTATSRKSSGGGSPTLTSSEADTEQGNGPPPICTGCKSGESASAFCVDCAHNLCVNCILAHRKMNCFEGHQVRELSFKTAKTSDKQQCTCLEHRTQPLKYFCLSCNFAICKDCTLNDHRPEIHKVELIEDVAEHQLALMETLINDSIHKQIELHNLFRLIDSIQQRLNTSFQRAQNQIDENAKFMITCIQEAQKSLKKDLQTTFGCKQLHIAMVDKEVQKMTKKMSQTIEFTERLMKFSSATEILVFKPLLDVRLQGFMGFSADPQLLSNGTDIDIPDFSFSQIHSAVYSLMSAMKPDTWVNAENGLVANMSSEQFRGSPNENPSSNEDSALGSSCQNIGFVGSNESAASSVPQTNHFNPAFGGASAPAASYLASALESASSRQAFNQYEKWSSGLELGVVNTTAGLDLSSLTNTASDLDEKLQNVQLYPPRSQIKRQKMIYHCRFGEFGVMEGQFTEPSGVAVNAQNDIIVADTNNHRIQVFNKDGHFKFLFGECGKRDGQLLYPNRVAVNRITGDFIVTERSPTHQIQVYNQYGQFLRKFGANILQHPRGVCVDNQGRIIVVECKVMRVIIFDTYGNVQHKFSCSRYLEFPNGVCTNDKNEIFISDNRAHCIKVFNYSGEFLRQIGGEGLTNYPIGVGINAFGEVVIADNHNCFNLTVFNQEGALLSAMESKVKHAQCFDVAILEDGSAVLTSKDYRLYLYKYQQAV